MKVESRLRVPSRRGSIYVVVLGVSTLVMVIGLSAVLATHVQIRASTGSNESQQARLLASSGVEIALFLISTDPNWRTNFISGTWVERTVNEGTLSFKLVDEIDGDLGNDPSQPVLIYAKGETGWAVRMESVQLEPKAPDSSTATNLLTNPGFESGATGWFGLDCNIVVDTAEQYAGTACLHVENRTNADLRQGRNRVGRANGKRSAAWAGPYQVLTSFIQCNTAYQVELWVKCDVGPPSHDVKVEISTFGSSSGLQWFSDGTTSVGNTWTKVTTVITPTWSGILFDARLSISTVGSTKDRHKILSLNHLKKYPRKGSNLQPSAPDDFEIDEVTLFEQGDLIMATVSGSWQQETN